MKMVSGRWDFSKRQGDYLAGFPVAWTADVVSIDGAHYHFWVPIELKDHKEELKEFLLTCEIRASYQGDPVSFSYEFR